MHAKLAAFGMAVGLALCAGPTLAAAPDYGATTLTGDWGGVRQQLHDRGIDLGATYVGDLAYNLTGGTRHAYAYADQFDLTADFDFDKMFGWSGGSLHVDVDQRGGAREPIEGRAGFFALLSAQEIYGDGRVTRLRNLYLEQTLWNNSLDVKVGRIGFDVDFYPFSCDFMSLKFCATIPSWIAHDLNAWPESQVGATFSIHPTSIWYLNLGVFKVNPNNTSTSNGLRFLPKGGNTGTLMVAEAGVHTNLPWGASAMPGTWRLGAWRNTAKYHSLLYGLTDIPLAAQTRAALRYDETGVYFLGNQQITHNSAGGGLTLFVNYVKSESHIDFIDRMVSVGMFYKAPFESRPNDQVNFVVGRDYYSDDAVFVQRANTGLDSLQLRSQDTVELDYSAQVHAGVALLPNVQYIRHVGGLRDLDHAIVLGLQVSVTF